MGFHYKDAPARWRRRPPVSTEACQGFRLAARNTQEQFKLTPSRPPEDMLTLLLQKVSLLMVALVMGGRASRQSPAQSQRPETPPFVDNQAQPVSQQRDQTAPLVDQFAQTHPTASELRTVASVLLRNFAFEEYQFRSAAEVMPADKYGYRPAEGNYGGGFPRDGPKEMRTFGAQVKHVTCPHLPIAGGLDGKKTPPHCDKRRPSPPKTRDQANVFFPDSVK